MEYQHFFESGTDEDLDPIYKVQILNNIQPDTGLIWNSRRECEFCRRDHKENCDFSFADSKVTLKDIVRHMDASRNLVLVITWRASNPRANISLLEKPHTIIID